MPKAKTIREAILHFPFSNPFISVFNRYTGNSYYRGNYIDCPDNLKDLPLISIYSEKKNDKETIYFSVDLL